jgi:hypothetical protein
MSGDLSSMDLPPLGRSLGDLPYGVDIIQLRISWPATPESCGTTGGCGECGRYAGGRAQPSRTCRGRTRDPEIATAWQ